MIHPLSGNLQCTTARSKGASGLGGVRGDDGALGPSEDRPTASVGFLLSDGSSASWLTEWGGWRLEVGRWHWAAGPDDLFLCESELKIYAEKQGVPYSLSLSLWTALWLLANPTHKICGRQRGKLRKSLFKYIFFKILSQILSQHTWGRIIFAQINADAFCGWPHKIMNCTLRLESFSKQYIKGSWGVRQLSIHHSCNFKGNYSQNRRHTFSFILKNKQWHK